RPGGREAEPVRAGDLDPLGRVRGRVAGGVEVPRALVRQEVSRVGLLEDVGAAERAAARKRAVGVRHVLVNVNVDVPGRRLARLADAVFQYEIEGGGRGVRQIDVDDERVGRGGRGARRHPVVARQVEAEVALGDGVQAVPADRVVAGDCDDAPVDALDQANRD